MITIEAAAEQGRIDGLASAQAAVISVWLPDYHSALGIPVDDQVALFVACGGGTTLAARDAKARNERRLHWLAYETEASLIAQRALAAHGAPPEALRAYAHARDKGASDHLETFVAACDRQSARLEPGNRAERRRLAHQQRRDARSSAQPERKSP